MRIGRPFSRQGIVLIILTIAVVIAVTYGVVSYQTPYGCDPSGVASGPGIDWQVLAKPCIYIYFTGIVGGSALLILLIPVPQKKSSVPVRQEINRVAICHGTILSAIEIFALRNSHHRTRNNVHITSMF